MKKIILLLLSIFQFSVLISFAQTVPTTPDTEEYNRWSASLYGGYVFGENDRGLQIFVSRFNVVSEPSWAAGGDIRYALNSFWSLETGYRYTTLEGVGFETTIHTASIKNTFNLNRFYRRSSLSEYVNPYVILGVEQDWFTAEGPADEFSRSEASLIGGLGVAFRLNDRIEIFGQHEIKLSSNHLDLQNQGYPYDQIGMASGGIRFHFGRSDRRPVNLRPATRTISDTEYEDIFARARDVDNLSDRVDSLENQINQLDSDNSDRFAEMNERLAALEDRVDSLEAKTNCLCERVEDVEEEVSYPESEIRRTVAAGHYIQVYAAMSLNDAIEVRNSFREQLGDDLNDAADEVFIIQRRQFYEVLIGVFNEFSNAQNILPTASAVMGDAFIITFPRPVHLAEQYEGTVIVHDE
ncbi:hypothetical protein DYD21_02350 [Rhodohalobacter sp. SW132]|uniref:outer membrane beta-barrel protein n=1 Tax=Rhodohalobacter sp. SW132 TaxID=2293433 RepID=UPI000E226F4F|nr:outer membrane beta-barrel protein [Rhodohalobacter sp. SW132]REL38815.1 hypothetical protein DYD21_02350 [Rhodohalobacter sp. SW132]